MENERKDQVGNPEPEKKIDDVLRKGLADLSTRFLTIDTPLRKEVEDLRARFQIADELRKETEGFFKDCRVWISLQEDFDENKFKCHMVRVFLKSLQEVQEAISKELLEIGPRILEIQSQIDCLEKHSGRA